MGRKTRSPLVLNFDTIRALTDEEAAKVVGGDVMPSTDSCGTDGCGCSPGTFQPAPCDGSGPTNPSSPGACTTHAALRCTVGC